MVQKFTDICKEVMFGPITYDPVEKDSLDSFVHSLESNRTEHDLEMKKEMLWQQKLEEQKKHPWHS
jgi:hypothetical protein